MLTHHTTRGEHLGGSVYTPPWLATFLVDRLTSAAGSTDSGRWLDPACGDGALLEAIVHRLATTVQAGDLPGVVKRRLFGVDLDPAACERARDRLREAVAVHGGDADPGMFDGNIRCADFLELDERCGLDPTFIVANPPYVSATQITSAHKLRYTGRFGSAWGRLDLYGLFLEQSLRLLRRGGVLSFVTPDKWMVTTSSGPLRALVVDQGDIRSIARFERHDLFPGVATVPSVTVIEKTPRTRSTVDVEWFDLDRDGTPVAREGHDQIRPDVRGSPWLPLATGRNDAAVTLGEVAARISVGLATGLNRCFVLDEAAASHVEPELLRPVLRGRDIGTEEVADPRRWLLLPYEFGRDGRAVGLIDLADFPQAHAHLASYRRELEQRHCVRVWRKAWFDLHDPVLVDVARQQKIVLPDVAYSPRFTLDRGERVPLHSTYYIVLRDDAVVSAEELLAVLQSDEVAAALRRRAPTAKSGYRRFRAQVLRGLPLHLPRRRRDQQLSLPDAA